MFSGSDFHENPIDGTSTCASIWHVARVPVKRKCLPASSYFAGSPVDFQTILKLMRAGVATESNAGQRGWSTTATFCISSVKVFPSALILKPLSGTGTTQYSPDGAIGGWKSCIWLAGTACPPKSVSHICVNVPFCFVRAAQ